MGAGLPYALRPATAADVDFLCRLVAATMRGYIEAVGAWDDADQAARFRARFDPARWHVIVADGRDVGGLAVERHPRALFLADLHLLPAYQGRGVGPAPLPHYLLMRTPPGPQ